MLSVAKLFNIATNGMVVCFLHLVSRTPKGYVDKMTDKGNGLPLLRAGANI
jgi:hypothetical protein